MNEHYSATNYSIQNERANWVQCNEARNLKRNFGRVNQEEHASMSQKTESEIRLKELHQAFPVKGLRSLESAGEVARLEQLFCSNWLGRFEFGVTATIVVLDRQAREVQLNRRTVLPMVPIAEVHRVMLQVLDSYERAHELRRICME